MEKLYFAIIGDIVNSKLLENRLQVQEKLSKLLDDINKRYESSLSSKFMITLGDEFQGLLHEGSSLMEIIEYIEDEMWPIKLRFGIGIGGITTSINYEMPFGADGPAYYQARAVIEQFKDSEKRKRRVASNIGVGSGEMKEVITLVNTLLAQNYFIKQQWSIRQREIIKYYRESDDTQQAVAMKLGINQSSVQRSLRSSGYYVYQQALDCIEAVFERIGDENNA